MTLLNNKIFCSNVYMYMYRHCYFSKVFRVEGYDSGTLKGFSVTKWCFLAMSRVRSTATTCQRRIKCRQQTPWPDP